MQAKFKVGDEVCFKLLGTQECGRVEGMKTVCTIKVGSGNIFYRDEEDLKPYVRPLQVGDRVLWMHNRKVVGKLCHTNPKWSCVEEDDGQLSVFATGTIERIPEGSDAG